MMRVRGSLRPGAAFTVEPIPNRPGMCLARFFENAEPYKDADPYKGEGWVYDEYHLELIGTGGLETDIEANFDTFLEQAKLADPEYVEAAKKQELIDRIRAENAELRGQIASLEGQLTDAQLALCDVYELMLGGDA